MEKLRIYLGILLLVFSVLYASCEKDTNEIEEERSFGLLETPENELAQIPIASPIVYSGNFPEQFYLETPPPEEKGQGREGSCVAWALAYGLKSYDLHKSYYDTEGNFDYSHVCSPEYMYNQIKISDCRSGSYFTPAFELLKTQGVCTWELMPYSDEGCSTMPNILQTKEANKHKILSYKRITDLSEQNIKILLLNKYPIVIGARLDDHFMRADRNFIWEAPFGTFKGNHAMVICGYNDNKNAFKIINSWGRDFGDDGYIWCNYDFLKQVVFEAYITEADENNDDSHSEEELIAHYNFNGNFMDETNKNIVTIDNKEDLILTDTYLNLKNSYDGDPKRFIRLNINSSLYSKIQIITTSYYIHKGGYTMSGLGYGKKDTIILRLTHNDYHYQYTNNVGQYDLREHIYLQFYQDSVNYQTSDLLPLVENKWIEEKTTIDFQNNIAQYHLTYDNNNYNIELSSINLTKYDNGVITFQAWDWANGSELRIDELKIFGYK